MRIAVCIKQVPDTVDLRMDETRWTLVREGIPCRINPHDVEAMEVALTIKDQLHGEVLVLTMGPSQSEEALREALAMGADHGFLLSDPRLSGADTLATSTALAQAIRKVDPAPDLILCGARSTDSDTGQVGPQVAEDLGIPHIAYVEEVNVDGEALRVRRVVDRQVETFRVGMPVLLTILRASVRPRDIALHAIDPAFASKEVTCFSLEQLGLDPGHVGFAGSATWVRRIREPDRTRFVNLVEGTPEEAVDSILKALRDHYVFE
jgi:electron transfer flavoprotein beta subunit